MPNKTTNGQRTDRTGTKNPTNPNQKGTPSADAQTKPMSTDRMPSKDQKPKSR